MLKTCCSFIHTGSVKCIIFVKFNAKDKSKQFYDYSLTMKDLWAVTEVHLTY